MFDLGRHTSSLGKVLRVAAEGKVTAMRAIAFVTIVLMLGGCMQETLAPTTQAGWSSRDRQLMSNLPYAQASIPVIGFFITCCLRARLSAMALLSAKMLKPGAASPPSAARKNGHPGLRP